MRYASVLLGLDRSGKDITPGITRKCPAGVQLKDHPASTMDVTLSKSADVSQRVHGTDT
jgi:hypothetical protein